MASDPRLACASWEVNDDPAFDQTAPRDSLQQIVQDLPLKRMQRVVRSNRLQWRGRPVAWWSLGVESRYQVPTVGAASAMISRWGWELGCRRVRPRGVMTTE